MRLLFPEACLLCGQGRVALCDSCNPKLPPPPVLGLPANVMSLVAVMAYAGVGRELVTAMKYRNRRGLLPWMGTAIAMRVNEPGLECVTWIPCSRAGRRVRGYDPGRLLARAVAHELRIPLRRLIVRSRDRPQTGRSRLDRQSGPGLGAVSERLAWRSVLLVDDVCTTGSSIQTAAAVLSQAGVEFVHAAVAARTPLTSDSLR